MRIRTTTAVALAIACAAAAVHMVLGGTPKNSDTKTSVPLVTGKRITPEGTQTNVGSFPDNLVLSPDGRYILVTNTGFREYLSILRSADGKLVSRLDFNKPSGVFPKKKESLYYGLAFGKTTDGVTTVYASRGGEGMISVLALDGDGIVKDTGRTLTLSAESSGAVPHVAGLAVSGDGAQIYAADNMADTKNDMRSTLRIMDASAGAETGKVDIPGYPFAVAAMASADRKVYVTSEQHGTVSVIDPAASKSVREIATGAQPIGLLLNKAQTSLFVANAGSDTVSVVDTKSDRVTKTILLRPDYARGLAGATPTGMALSPDEKHLYVTLADMNAVAIVDVASGSLNGYVPVGWYPTAVVASPDGARLFVSNAKGVAERNPNGSPNPELKERPQYIQNIIEGTVSTIDLRALPPLKETTSLALTNNQGLPAKTSLFRHSGIKHVFYIIKENRTYDQVLGDLPQGNGDPSLVLFGKDVTPNLHALAQRFVLLDNFYCCAEVSGDGWNWSTGAMASEYTARNVPHNYGGRQRPYDFEGTNNGIAVDRADIPDVARPPGGYLWDQCATKGVSFRNYGFFTDDLELPRTEAEQGTKGLENSPTKKALLGKSNADFRQFDLTYADSEAWVTAKIDPAPKQMTSYGTFHDPSRVTTWKREFAQYVKNGDLPSLSLLRVMRDHTSGTTAGASSARAMVADNDYAVGQIVETISHSPYWKSSAIVIVEDDAQNGYDHVDAHRSIAFVISPFIAKASHDSRFYNTDSALHTIELLLGLPPMTQYDAIAPAIDVFGSSPDNLEPYDAVLPAREILAEVNKKKEYRAQDSARLLNPLKEESGPDEQLNDILWRSIKGTAPPPRRYSLAMISKKDDDD